MAKKYQDQPGYDPVKEMGKCLRDGGPCSGAFSCSPDCPLHADYKKETDHETNSEFSGLRNH